MLLDVESHFQVTLAAYTAAFVTYLAFTRFFIQRLQHAPWALPLVLVLAVLARLLVIPVKPCDDLYRFAFEAKVTRAGFNPAVYAPASPQVAALRQGVDSLINHPTVPSVYPRMAQAAFRLGFPTDGSWWRWRTLLLLADGLSMALLWSHSPLSAVLYGLNPLLIFEGVGRGHFEPLVLMALIAAWRACCARLDAVFGLCLAIGISLKPHAGLLVLPWLLAGAWRRPKAYLALVLITVSALDAYLSVGETLQAFLKGGQYNSALPWLWNSLWKMLWPSGPLAAMGWALSPVILAGIGLLLITRRPLWSFERMALWLIGGLLLSATVFHPWYVLWILPFAVLRREPFWLAMSATAILGLWPYWLQSQGQPWAEVAWVRSIFFLPPLALWIVVSFAPWWSPLFPPSTKKPA